MLSNRAKEPIDVQLQVKSWQQLVNGEERFEPTQDVIVVPPIVRLEGNVKQVIRKTNVRKDIIFYR